MVSSYSLLAVWIRNYLNEQYYLHYELKYFPIATK